MTEQWATPITAEWAWISADSGAVDSAGIQANSGGEFESLIHEYVTGSPDSRIGPEAPDAPPWVTFGPSSRAETECLLSVSVRDPFERPDRSKRPISPRRFFLFEFKELAKANASYQTIWETVDPVQLRALPAQRIRLDVRREQPTRLIAMISPIFDRLALLAAALLVGRVVVKDTGALNRDQRLAVIDAVAALLPYGFRADLSASTGVQANSEYDIRLVFAEYGGDNQIILSLYEDEPDPGPGLALNYLNMLRDKMKISGLDRVVTYLWDDKEELNFQHPEAALERLAKLAPEDYWVRILCDERLTREQVLAFFAESAPVVISTWQDPRVREVQEHVIELLLLHQDDQVTGILRRYWETVVDSVTGWALRWLDEGDTDRVTWLLRVASRGPRGAEDDLLEHLLREERADREPRYRISLLTVLLGRTPDPPGTFPRSLRELREGQGGAGHPLLVHELLGRQANLRGAIAWTQWLCDTDIGERRDGLPWPPWMQALSCVLYGTRGQWQFTAASVGSLIKRSPEWVVMLRLAEQTGHLANILDDIWPDLVAVAVRLALEDGQAARRTAVAVALGSDSLRLGGTMTAIMDSVRVLLGLTPSSLLLRPTRPAFEAYDQGLRMVFGRAELQGAEGLLEQGFLDHAFRNPPPWPEGAIWLIQGWATDVNRAPGLAQYVVDKDMGGRLGSYEQLDGDFWRELVRCKPELEPYASGPMVRAAAKRTVERRDQELQRTKVENSVPTTQLAYVMSEAFIAGMLEKDILPALLNGKAANGKDITSIEPVELDDVLRQFRQLVFYDQRRNLQDTSREAFLEFYTLISKGELGTAYGRDFAWDVIPVLRSEIESRKEAIQILSGALGRWSRLRLRLFGGRSRRHKGRASRVPDHRKRAGGAG